MATVLYDDAAVAAAELELRRRIRDAYGPHIEYQSDPIGWARDRLGIPEHMLRWSLNPGYEAHVWDGTPDPLATAFEAIRDWQDAAIESATGVGKSYGAAILILWFLACFEDCQVFTFALTSDQLKLFIWRNITELWPRFHSWFPAAEITSLCIRMRGGIDDTWSAHGRPVQLKAGETVASRAQGMHEEHMLLVYEEAAAMEWAIIEAGRNTTTRPHNLRLFIGNPNHQLDSLHRISQQSDVVAVRASALDHPNVVSGNPDTIPGTISAEKLESRRREYGETSPLYLSRIRGISPEQAANALIRLEWLKAANIRYQARAQAGTLPTMLSGRGVDAANSEHGDRACIVDFKGNACTRVEAFQCPDSNQLGARIAHEARLSGLEHRRIGVDAIGVGAGTVNKARELGVIVQAIYAGSKPVSTALKLPDGRVIEWGPDTNRFQNVRGQMYWQTREDLRSNLIDVPEDRELWEELTAFTFEDDGKVVKLEPKEDVKLRLGRSPDKADAFVMANWVRERAVIPPVADQPQGISLGYDYANKRPIQRQSADDIMRGFVEHRGYDPLAGRYDA